MRTTTSASATEGTAESITSLWRHLRAVLVLPATVTLFVPAAILYLTRTGGTVWELPSWAKPIPFVLGGGLLAMGLALVAWTVTLFGVVGRGTLAPWDPTSRLVVRGPYRYVRNPMITGVMCVLLGEAVIVRSLPLLGWLAVFFLANAVYLPRSEERGLEERFGEEYRLYRRNVPRWVPRLRPWSPPIAGHFDSA